jgi:hypothetical protein
MASDLKTRPYTDNPVLNGLARIDKAGFLAIDGIRNARHREEARQYARAFRRGNYYVKGNSGGRVTFGWNCARQGVTSLASHASALRLISSGK